MALHPHWRGAIGTRLHAGHVECIKAYVDACLRLGDLQKLEGGNGYWLELPGLHAVNDKILLRPTLVLCRIRGWQRVEFRDASVEDHVACHLLIGDPLPFRDPLLGQPSADWEEDGLQIISLIDTRLHLGWYGYDAKHRYLTVPYGGARVAPGTPVHQMVQQAYLASGWEHAEVVFVDCSPIRGFVLRLTPPRSW